jgi:hypothetical protein
MQMHETLLSTTNALGPKIAAFRVMIPRDSIGGYQGFSPEDGKTRYLQTVGNHTAA